MKDYQPFSYNDRFSRPDDSFEKVETNAYKPNPYIKEQLILGLRIDEQIYAKMQFEAIMDHHIDKAYTKSEELLNKSYKHEGQDYFNSLQDSNRNTSINISEKKKKIRILRDILQNELTIDKFKYRDENDKYITFFTVDIDDLDEGNENEDTCIYIYPEFVLSRTGHIQPSQDEDKNIEIVIDQIKEIIVDETKYTFL